jgi:hypothetical protein
VEVVEALREITAEALHCFFRELKIMCERDI